MRLGLDLKGGVHLVMRVQTDDAVRLETETTADRLREQMKTQNIAGTVTVASPTEFRVDGVPPEQDAAFRQLLTDVELTFNRAPGAGSYTFTMRPNIADQLREEAVDAGAADDRAPRQRAGRGRADHRAAQRGRPDSGAVAGRHRRRPREADHPIDGATRAEAGRAGSVHRRSAARQAYNNNLPPDLADPARHQRRRQAGERPATVYYVVRRVPAVTGRDLRNSRPSLDENSRPAVELLAEQRRREPVRHVHAGQHQPAAGHRARQPGLFGANHQSRIDNEGIIQGSFTQQEAADLSLVLRSGALPATLDLSRGAHRRRRRSGRDSIRSGVTAAIGGLLFVMLFMLAYYKLSGFNAVASIVVNLIILLGLMAYLGATMTLPGIAGFILTIGMGVDSNVLIFERIKEELQTAKGVKQAVAAGFDRVFLTILDTHVASLIAAAFLFQFGTGPIRGFATTLTIGLLSNVFTAVFVSRTMFELVLSRRNVAKLSI